MTYCQNLISTASHHQKLLLSTQSHSLKKFMEKTILAICLYIKSLITHSGILILMLQWQGLIIRESVWLDAFETCREWVWLSMNFAQGTFVKVLNASC